MKTDQSCYKNEKPENFFCLSGFINLISKELFYCFALGCFSNISNSKTKVVFGGITSPAPF